jgi:hypothetical protein
MGISSLVSDAELELSGLTLGTHPQRPGSVKHSVSPSAPENSAGVDVPWIDRCQECGRVFTNTIGRLFLSNVNPCDVLKRHQTASYEQEIATSEARIRLFGQSLDSEAKCSQVAKDAVFDPTCEFFMTG